ncbi:MAG: hypothetical protein RLZZ172_973, partial [Bacteroidota bacterium]
MTLGVKAVDGVAFDWYDQLVDGAMIKQDSVQHTLFDVQSTTTVYVLARDILTGCVSDRIPVEARVNVIPQ